MQKSLPQIFLILLLTVYGRSLSADEKPILFEDEILPGSTSCVTKIMRTFIIIFFITYKLAMMKNKDFTHRKNAGYKQL